MKDLLKPKVRKYLYGVAAAGTAVLYAKGVITEADVVSFNALAAALFGLAMVNVNDDEPDTED